MKTILNISLVILFLAVLAAASQDIDIPTREYGFTIGDKSGNLHLEFVLDLLCVDSREQFRIWKNVMNRQSLLSNKVKFTYQFNPLPYHFYAVKVTQGFYYILDQFGESAAERYMDYIFENQESYAEEEHMDDSVSKFCDKFAQQINAIFGGDLSKLRGALNMGGDYFQKVRNNWKYVAGVKGAPGAPLFYANGVRVDGAQGYTEQKWIEFIKTFKSRHTRLQ